MVVCMVLTMVFLSNVSWAGVTCCIFQIYMFWVSEQTDNFKQTKNFDDDTLDIVCPNGKSGVQVIY